MLQLILNSLFQIALFILQSPSGRPLLFLLGAVLLCGIAYVCYWLTLYGLNKRRAYYVKEITLPVGTAEEELLQIDQMRSTFASLQGYILSNTTKLSLEMYKTEKGIRFLLGSTSKHVLEKAETSLKQIRNIVISDIQEDLLIRPEVVYGKTVSNVKDFYQITQDEHFFDNLLSLLNSLPHDTFAGVQFVLRGVNKNEEMQRRRRDLELKAVKAKRRQTDRETYLFLMYQKKQEGNLFKVKINVVASKRTYLSSLVAQLKTLNFEENTFFSRNESTRNITTRFLSPDTYFSNVHWMRKHEGSYLTNRELAYLFHPTHVQLGTLATTQTSSIEAQPAFLEMRDDNIRIGKTTTPQGEHDLYYPLANLRRHSFAIGKTGSGKSSLLVTLLHPLVTQGDSTVIVLDPHGDLLTDLLASITNDGEAKKRVKYFNIHKTTKTFTINPLFAFQKTDIQKAVIRDKLLDIIKNETEEVAGATTTGAATLNRLKQIVEVALEFPDAYFSYLTKQGGLSEKRATQLVWERQLTLNDLPKLLTPSYDYFTPLKEVFATNTTDAGSYVNREMADHMREKAVVEAVRSRLSQLLHPSLKYIYEGNSLSMEGIMTSGKTFLFPIPQRMFGSYGSRGLLQIMFSLLWIAKQEVEEKDKRRDTYVVIDEFQNAQIEDIPYILSEARKYKLSLFVSNQYLGQLKEKIKNAIFGNVGTLISFTVGAGENGASVLAKNFDDFVTEKDLTLLPSYHAYIKTKIPNTDESRTFSFTTIPVPENQDDTFIAELNETSLNEYGEEKEVIEKRLLKKKESPLDFFFEGIAEK